MHCSTTASFWRMFRNFRWSARPRSSLMALKSFSNWSHLIFSEFFRLQRDQERPVGAGEFADDMAKGRAGNSWLSAKQVCKRPHQAKHHRPNARTQQKRDCFTVWKENAQLEKRWWSGVSWQNCRFLRSLARQHSGCFVAPTTDTLIHRLPGCGHVTCRFEHTGLLLRLRQLPSRWKKQNIFVSCCDDNRWEGCPMTTFTAVSNHMKRTTSNSHVKPLCRSPLSTTHLLNSETTATTRISSFSLTCWYFFVINFSGELGEDLSDVGASGNCKHRKSKQILSTRFGKTNACQWCQLLGIVCKCWRRIAAATVCKDQQQWRWNHLVVHIKAATLNGVLSWNTFIRNFAACIPKKSFKFGKTMWKITVS